MIADIGGYTTYLTGVELDHSQDILADVIHTVVDSLCGPFDLAKLEGDAVFCYQPGDPAPAEAVIGIIDQTYAAFHDRLRAIRYATACRCEACLRIPNLTLKFVVHAGEFVIHEIAGNKELVGKDIIVIHRLLKNQVVETHGIQGYAFLTDACLTRHAIDRATHGFADHTEPFDDVGEIEGGVLDLEARRVRDEGEHGIRITPDRAHAVFSMPHLPLTPEEFWRWLTDAELRPRWQEGVVEVRRQGQPGPVGMDTFNHCMHGPEIILEQIVGWKPYDYYTSRFHFIDLGYWTWTYELIPDAGTTTLNLYVHFDEGDEQRSKAPQILPQMKELFATNERNLRELLERARTGTDIPST